ncbi:zinc ribbon domain-containing protein [Bacillus mexicanus]|uniref:zinc ribbon domain-containing protein n=1 Tax=Bacillus mexicanus TaxID=2834415 RepID=UPI003D221F4E
MCSNCGQQGGPKLRYIRTWTCIEFGCVHDRDINAANEYEKRRFMTYCRWKQRCILIK